MTAEIPSYAMKAYALFYVKYGTKKPFRQSELDWIVSSSMKKKIFYTLIKSGWIKKKSRNEYLCEEPKDVLNKLLEFKVPEIIKKAKKPYAFTQLSSIEIWSDFSYIQRGIEKSPYFIKVLKKDLKYWKKFFNQHNIPNYVNEGSCIGEYVILIPEEKIKATKKGDFMVESLTDALNIAKKNEMFAYPYNYMRQKYGPSA